MPTFSVFVLGAGGGPSETNLSAYFFKPHNASWRDGIVALEAGSGIGKLTEIIREQPTLFHSNDGDVQEFVGLSAQEVYSLIRCFLISHAHLDHVASLVLSAGSLQGPRRRIHGSKRTIKNLESVFNGKIWPNLASSDPNDEAYKLLYDPLLDRGYRNIFRDVSVRMMPLNHGLSQTGSSSGPYESSAFFLRYDPTGKEFLFFGDVEPDSISAAPQTIHVWRAAAPKIPKTLSAVFIECSWPSGRDDSALFGHLTPEHLVDELVALAAEVVLARQSGRRGSVQSPDSHTRKKRRTNPVLPDAMVDALAGLRVYITHCKDAPEGFERQHGKTPIHRVIADQVRTLVNAKGLGAEIHSAEQGSHIII